MLLTTENIILIGALLLLVSVFAGKVAYRFGAPALLLILGPAVAGNRPFTTNNTTPASVRQRGTTFDLRPLTTTPSGSA